MRTDLLCFDCLELYGGEEKRCPGIPNCLMSKYPAYDVGNAYEQRLAQIDRSSMWAGTSEQREAFFEGVAS